MACAKKQSLIWYAYTYCHLLLLIRCPTYLGNRSSRIDRTFSTSFVRALATEGTKYKGFIRIEYYSAGRYVAWVDMLSYLPMVPMCCSFGREPLPARGGGLVAQLELSTLGYRVTCHGWLLFVLSLCSVFVSQITTFVLSLCSVFVSQIT